MHRIAPSLHHNTVRKSQYYHTLSYVPASWLQWRLQQRGRNLFPVPRETQLMYGDMSTDPKALSTPGLLGYQYLQNETLEGL